MSFFNFIALHLAYLVVLEEILRLSGVKTFSTDDSGLVDVTAYQSRVVEYFALGSALVCILFSKIKNGEKINFPPRLESFVEGLFNKTEPIVETSIDVEPKQ